MITDQAATSSRLVRLTAKSLHDLEWPGLLEQIAKHCNTRGAAQRVLALRPADSLGTALERTTRLGEALRLAAQGTELPRMAIEDLSPLLGRLCHGLTASATELVTVMTVLHQAKALRDFGRARAEQLPCLARLLVSDPALDSLQGALERAIDADGTVKDEASPELLRARRRAREVRRELLRRIEQLLDRHQDVLRDRYWVERDGRYVLPIRADAHFRVVGIVLGSSASGGTLYLEPQEITPLGNRLSVCQAETERAELSVLSELSGQVREFGEALANANEICFEVDVLAATVQWAAAASAHAVPPTPEPRIRLLSMRHPLLTGRETAVVPHDIALDAGRALVISGPNAGGKTVALKCLGLAACMVRSGLPLPADPDSVVGWWDPVLTDVGDEQSLARSLSTFSAHITNLSDMLEVAGPHTLVLLDELVAGTDPEEGSVLATAVLEALLEKGAAIAVTTHYERLKEQAYTDARFLNASVGFDWEAMAPSFRLTLGLPGPSSALAVATRFGIPATVVARARSLLPDQSVDREQLVQRLMAEQAALAHAREQAEQEAVRQAALTEACQAERRELRERAREQLAQEAYRLMAEVRQARAEVRAALTRLRHSDLERAEVRELSRNVDRAATQVAVGSDLVRALSEPAVSDEPPVPPSALVVGARYYLARLSTVVELAEPPRQGRARVRVGGMKLSVSTSELGPVVHQGAGASPAPKTRTTRRRSSQAATFVPVRTGSTTLDLRGERVEDALGVLDAFLDRLLAQGEAAGFVLHGHGSGKLKSAVREHLSQSSYVERSRSADPDDGGDAFTVFWLKP